MYGASAINPFAPTTSATCAPPSPVGDSVDELRRHVVLVDDLRHRLIAVVALLPDHGAIDGWWGVARDALEIAVGIERARLSRQVEQLYGVRAQLELDANSAAARGLGASP